MSQKKLIVFITVLALALSLIVPSLTAQDTAKKSTDSKDKMAADKTPAKAKKTVTAQTPPEKGMVWANPDSKVYHKEGSRWYGKTKDGKWMTEADAQKAGYKEAGQGGAKAGAKKAAKTKG